MGVKRYIINTKDDPLIGRIGLIGNDQPFECGVAGGGGDAKDQSRRIGARGGVDDLGCYEVRDIVGIGRLQG